MLYLFGKKTMKQDLWGIVAVILISFVIYGNALNSPFFFDDMSNIVINKDIKNLSNIKTKLIYPQHKKINYVIQNVPSRPLVYLTFTLNYHFGKLNPFGYHLFNLIMHILNAILVFFLTKKIIYYAYQKISFLYPLIATLFFSVHPVNTEVVTYISHRAGSLAAFFYFAALLFFIKAFEKNKYFYAFSVICFVLALFSKQTTVTLPAIILSFDYIFLSNYKITKVIEKKYYHIPYWVILVVFLLFTQFYLGGIGDAITDAHVKWSNFSYFITQFTVIVKYMKLLLLARGLCVDHLIEPVKTILSPNFWVSFIFISGILILAYWNCKKKAQSSKIILFASVWFFITLFPTSSFIPIREAMTERRLYLPGVGFSWVVMCVYFLLSNVSIKKNLILKPKWLLLVILGWHISVYGIITFGRNKLYNNHLLMWQDAVSKYPDNTRAWANLGLAYQDKGEYLKALQKYEKVLEIDPEYMEVYNNIGNIYLALEKYEKAEKAYRKARGSKSGLTEAYYNLGILYRGQKKYDMAIQNFRNAIKFNPYCMPAYHALGATFLMLKEYEKAQKMFKSAIAVDSNYAQGYNALGVIWKELGNYDSAIQCFKKALLIDPGFSLAQKNMRTTVSLYQDQPASKNK